MAVYEHLGILNQNTNNFSGAIKAFQKMRDYAEDCKCKKREMEAYLLLGKVLEQKKDYKTARVVFKRLLQVAWFSQDIDMEMAAYT